MERTKTLLLTCIVVFSFAVNVFASDVFNGNGKKPERVWLQEISHMGEVEFETGNYRLDTDFRLGFGDTVVVNLWGKLEAKYELSVQRDGTISIPSVGKVSVIGLTLKDAQKDAKRELDRKFTNVELSITLSDVRDIRIYVMGNVKNPGPYAVSPFSRIIDAVAKAGGPNEQGSLVDIRLLREEKKVVSFDAYQFFLNNDKSKNIRLMHGDTVYVSRAKNLIVVKGDVRYPGIYEAQHGARLKDIIELSGGMLSTKFKRRVLVLRINPQNQQKEVIKEFIFDMSQSWAKEDILLEDDDTVIVATVFSYTPVCDMMYKNVALKGEFIIPGSYLASKEDTLKSLIKKAGGIKEKGFPAGAIFIRQSLKKKQKNFSDEIINAQKKVLLVEEAHLLEMVLTQDEKLVRQGALDAKKKALKIMAAHVPKGRMIIDLNDLLKGEEDILLENGDIIYVPQIPDAILVVGAVYNPESILFQEEKTADYYLNMVGGARKFADKEDIYVIKANGQVRSVNTGYGKIDRGDIIVVPEKVE